MIRTILPSHKHDLYPTPWVRHCDVCNRSNGDDKDGYRCYLCSLFFHKKCAESSPDIFLPTRHEHRFSLRTETDLNLDGIYCDLCGEALSRTLYICPICILYYVSCTACAINPPPNVIEYPKGHEHALIICKDADDIIRRCDFCEETYKYNSTRYLYNCSQCQLKFHFECSKLSLEIKYLYHSKHLVKLVTKEELHFSDGKCRICGNDLRHKFYHCSICKFSVDIDCVNNPPPRTILFAKAHEHQLNLMPRIISFNCDVCGMNGDRSPYICYECDFMIHQNCIDLPEIININRHEHRISRRIQLTPGHWICRVCYEKVDCSYGAYSCLICPNYYIHSKCATRDDVWDKLELKGIPEDTEDIEPFKTIHENVICHFSHKQHHLKLNEENIVYGGSIRCAACVSYIYSQSFYKCLECDFILHKICANLPRKKRHVYHEKQFNLICNVDQSRLYVCSVCKRLTSGFVYSANYSFNIDATCGALSESIIHESHSCPLYFSREVGKMCVVCNSSTCLAFRCKNCQFEVHPESVILPTRAEHWYDNHILSLCYENIISIGGYLCDMCEEELDTTIWFYKCDKCCATYHIKCVLGDFSFLKLGPFKTGYNIFEVMQTNPGFLPRCSICYSQRPIPFVLFDPIMDIYICSYSCLSVFT